MAKNDDKTEQPTGKRLRDARREGRLPQSTEVPQAATLIVAVILVPALIRRLQVTLVGGWHEAAAVADPHDPGPVLSVFVSLLTRSMLLLVPLIGGIIVAAVVARAMLGGVHFNTHQLKPKPKMLNPFPGIKRMFSIRQFGQLGRLAAKLGALGILALALWNRFTSAIFAGPSGLESFVSTIASAIGTLLVAVLALSIVAGGLDGTLAVRRYRKDLRMSKHEIREETKQLEANPMVKQEIRARQRKMSRMRMMADVVRADVVLTNPTHLAVALRYEPHSPAPKVVAKGAGHIAARIREVAAEAGVPVRENKPLARALYHSVEIGDLIPVQLYQAVAEVLALVYRAARRHGAQAAARPASTHAATTQVISAQRGSAGLPTAGPNHRRSDPGPTSRPDLSRPDLSRPDLTPTDRARP